MENVSIILTKNMFTYQVKNSIARCKIKTKIEMNGSIYSITVT